MILAEIQKIIVYRSQNEADLADFFNTHPEAILWFVGCGLILVAVLYFGGLWWTKKK